MAPETVLMRTPGENSVSERSRGPDGRRRTVLGVLDGGVFDVDGVDGVVGAASYGSDGQAMATGASTTSEDDVLQLLEGSRSDRKMESLTVPELTAKQSSWFCTLAFEIVTPFELPTSNASVLWPPAESPAELSIVIESRVSVSAPLMLKTCTGEFKILMLLIEDDLRL